MISSIDLTSRASSITCWASRTVIPSASSAAIIGGSTMSTPSGMSSTPSALQDLADLARGPPEQPGVGRHGAAQADHAGVDVLLGQPRAVQPVVLGRRPEVPDVRAAAARLERVAGHLVARPLADVRAGDVADVVEVEQQHRAEVGGVEGGLGAAEAVRAEAVGVDPLLPVDGHRSRRRERPHPDPSLQARRAHRRDSRRSLMLHSGGAGATRRQHSTGSMDRANSKRGRARGPRAAQRSDRARVRRPWATGCARRAGRAA